MHFKIINSCILILFLTLLCKGEKTEKTDIEIEDSKDDVCPEGLVLYLDTTDRCVLPVGSECENSTSANFTCGPNMECLSDPYSPTILTCQCQKDMESVADGSACSFEEMIENYEIIALRRGFGGSRGRPFGGSRPGGSRPVRPGGSRPVRPGGSRPGRPGSGSRPRPVVGSSHSNPIYGRPPPRPIGGLYTTPNHYYYNNVHFVPVPYYVGGVTYYRHRHFLGYGYHYRPYRRYPKGATCNKYNSTHQRCKCAGVSLQNSTILIISTVLLSFRNYISKL